MTRKNLMVLLFLFLFLFPVLYVTGVSKLDGILNFLATDAYYYLTAGVRTSSLANFTFDGIHATNGYHPFWSLIIWAMVHVVDGIDAQIIGMFVVNLALATLAFGILFNSLYQSTNKASALLLIMPGAFLAVSNTRLYYSLVPWRFINGMESSIELVFWALMLSALAKWSGAAERDGEEGLLGTGETVALGLICAGLVFSRLDNLALLPFIPLLFINQQQRVRKILIVAAMTVAPFILFLGYSLANGLPGMPVSGALKTIDPWYSITFNLATVLKQFVFFAQYTLGYRLTLSQVNRAQLIIPILVWFLVVVLLGVIGFIKNKKIAGLSPHGWPLFVALVMSAKTAYYLVLVPFWLQGFWYYMCPSAVGGFLLAYVVFRHELPKPAIYATCFVFIFLYANATMETVQISRNMRWLPHDLLDENLRADLRKRVLAASPEGKYIDMSDGIFSYFLGLPSVSGVGVGTDRAGYEALKSGRGDFFHRQGALHAQYIRRGYQAGLFSYRGNSGKILNYLVEREESIPDKKIIIYHLKPRPGPG